MVDGARGKVENGHPCGAPHRWSRRNDERVSREHGDCDDSGAPAANGDDREQKRGGRCENGDVAAGDRNHVVRAGSLQRFASLIRQAGSIADENSRCDRRRNRIVRLNPSCDGVPDVRPDVCAHLGPVAAFAHDIDQQTAFDGTQKGRAGECEVALEVGNAVIQVPSGPAIRDGRFERTACSPLGDSLLFSRPVDADRDATLDGMPDSAQLHCNDLDSERNEVAVTRCILHKHRAGQQRIVSASRTDGVNKKAVALLVQQPPDRRMQREFACIHGQRDAAHQKPERNRRRRSNASHGVARAQMHTRRLATSTTRMPVHRAGRSVRGSRRSEG